MSRHPRALPRRRFLQMLSLPLLLPRRARASGGADRKFIFLFANGGWDPTWGLCPMYDSSGIDSNPSGEAASVGDLRFVESEDGPALRTFFEAYGDRTCLVHGFEVRSITHERCKRLLLTGKSASIADDWPAQIAGNSAGYLLPHLVVSGPSYTSAYTPYVVRLGETGQLARLLDGSALTEASPSVEPLTGTAASAMAAFRQRRAEAWAESAGIGRAQSVGASLVRANEDLATVLQIEGLDLAADLEGGAGGLAALTPALDCLERGYARSVIISHGGQFDVGWDSHSDLEQQTANYEVLFEDLCSLMEDLDARSGQGGGTLADETTIVVLSEMGRSPVINGTGGKDHWTFTSAMFIGAGVAGGRAIGGYDDTLLGRRIDLESGEFTESGTLLGSENIGATILALADVEPESEPILAVLA